MRSASRLGWGFSFFLPKKVYDDDKYPFTAFQLNSPAGRIDYNYTDVGIDFQDNCIYPDDMLVAAAQMPHKRKNGSEILPHLHFLQNQNAIPNFLLAYRLYNNGDLVPASWVLATWNSSAFTYVSGTLTQIIGFPDIDGSALNKVSGWMDIKIYRDTTNASGLFAGNDPYTGNVTLKEYDNHLLIDSIGSRLPFVK